VIPPLEHPANTSLLRWLAPVGVPVPALLGEWEVHAYTLLASPELASRMLELAGAGGHCAVHGFPALVGEDGQVDVVAAGLSTLVVRCDDPSDRRDLVLTDVRPPFGWVAVDGWEADAGRLAELILAARLR
jgi:hypothetical protein